MKKTWKCWLGTVAAAMLGGTVMAQPPQGPGFGPPSPFGDEGAVRLGDVSGSARVGGPETVQFDMAQPLNADAIWGEAPLAYQGAPPPGDESIGFASAASYADVQYRVGRVNGNVYGFNGGYTTLNAFIPLASDDRNLWFMDPRLNITDYGEGAANFGIGYRRYSYEMDRIFGASFWYDYDPGHRSSYNQLGLSFENIGRYWSTRVNANVPLTDQNDFNTPTSFTGNPFFVGNNIGYIYSFLRETTYQNYTFEAAAPVPFFGRYGWEWAISGYGLVSNAASGEDAIGIGGRFEWQVAQDFWINTTLTHDRIFGTNTSINFELTIPSGKQTRWLRPMRVHDKILASVKRPYRVSTNTTGQTEQRLFLDPNDGAPIVVAHINPQAANGAAPGTVEVPFGSVQDYMNLTPAERAPFDIIYVGGNLLATNDNDLNTTIELLDRQRLLGTGALADGSVHQFQTIARTGGGFETLNLPNFGNSATATNTGPNPLLSNSGAAGTPVVRINGNYTEVTGFTIDAGGTADGIATVDAALAARTVDSFVITNNTIQSAIQAMDIRSNTTPGPTGPTTMPDVRSLTFDDNIGVISNNTISGTAGTVPGVTEGIVVVHSGGVDPLNLRVASNQINNVTDEAIDLSVTFGTIDASATNFGILNNTITASGVGVLADANGIGSVFNLAVQGNTVTNSTDAVNAADPTVGAGMIFLGRNLGTMNVESFISNTVTNNAAGGGGRGAAFVADGGFLNVQPAVAGQVPFTNNTFTGNADDAVLFAGQNLGALNVGSIGLNQFVGNGGDGIDIRGTTGSLVTVGPIAANNISGNLGNGINGLANNATVTVLVGSTATGVPANVITQNGQSGINFLANNGGLLQGSIQNNSITDNTLNGITLTAVDPNSHVNFHDLANGLLISDNLISGNTGAGVAILADNTGAAGGVDALFLRNAITGAAGNTQQFGILAQGLRTGDLDIDIGDGTVANANNVSGNSDANIDVELAGASTASVVINANQITNAINGPNVDFAGDGVVFRTTDAAQLYDAQVLNNTITGNADDGIRVLTNGTSQLHALGDPTTPGLIIQGNQISANLGDGIQIERQGSSVVRGIIGTAGGVGLDATFGNLISGNRNHGINVVTGGGANAAGVSTNLTVGQNLITANGTTTVGNGVNIVTNADSQTRVDLISNTITGGGTQDNGVSVTTNNASYFGTFGGANSLFDGNIITGHAANGIALTTNNISSLNVDIFGNTQQAQITANGANGISISDTSTGGAMTVNIGNPASTAAGTVGADVAPDAPDVIIAQNINDAIRVNDVGGGTVTLNVNNTLATGNRTTGGVSRHGLSYNSDLQQNSSGLALITVDNSTFVDFGGDGMNFFYDIAGPNDAGSNPAVAAQLLTVNVTDSIIGQTQFSTNVGDGVDIEVRDNGSRFTFNNNLIQNNGGDGVRLSVHAEDLRAGSPTITLNRDSDNNAQNDVVTPGAVGLNPLIPYGSSTFVDVTTQLTFTNNTVNFNGDDGLDIALGAATRLGTAATHSVITGNTLSGNTNFGFLTRTQNAIAGALINTSGAPNLGLQNQVIALDPLAQMFIDFSNNVGTQLNPTVVGGVYANDLNKSATTNRPILTAFNVFGTNVGNVFTLSGNPDPAFNRFVTNWTQQRQIADRVPNGPFGGAGVTNYFINALGSVN